MKLGCRITKSFVAPVRRLLQIQVHMLDGSSDCAREAVVEDVMMRIVSMVILPRE